MYLNVIYSNQYRLQEMTTSKVLRFGSTESFGSVIETTAILDQLLRPEGYKKDTIVDIATSLFVNNERMRIHDDASMHLIAIKKTLLYAIPIITSPNSTSGILITSQVVTPAIQFNNDKVKSVGLAIGDKFRLLGFAFPNRLINHLAYSIFPQKYYEQLPDSYKIQPLNISKLNGITAKNTSKGKIYIVDRMQYENTNLFNQINKLMANKLMEEMTALLMTHPRHQYSPFQELQRIIPYNDKDFITQLNTILERKISVTFSMSLYEALQTTSNWMLYDYIMLLGFASPEISERLRYLEYVKNQNLKVRQNIRDIDYQKLLTTRAEKICRDKYPFFFDFTDRRSIFIKFNRFDINKLPSKEQSDIRILLEKELDAQNALLKNKCEHLKYIKSINTQFTVDTYNKIEQYIDFQSLGSDGMYPCKLCKYPLLCVHMVELYEALASLTDTNDNSDQSYWANQKIINKYKLINHKKTGMEDTETIFTYYCKHCGGELGKSDDIIQASIKTQEESSMYNESTPYEKMIYINVSSNISKYMNTNAISLNPKIIIMTISDAIKDEIIWMVQQSNYTNEENIELLIRYLTQIYTFTSLISLNLNKIKFSQSVLLSEDKSMNSATLKDELLSSFKIVKNISVYKQIGITDDKVKTILVQAFKFVNKIFSNEAIILKSVSPSDKLIMDIENSPLVNYAKFMYHRFEKSSTDTLSIAGIDMDKLFPK